GEAAPAQAPLGVGQGPGDDRLEVVGAQRLQPEQQRAAHQGRVHGEERVLGGRPDQNHRAVLDPGQQGVLLALVEPVDLVDEQDAAPPQGAQPLAGRGARTSLTPALVADSSSKCDRVALAMMWASEVLPVPAGPHRITERSSSASIRARRALWGPSTWPWPTNSSSVRGRIRAARGASWSPSRSAPSENRSR